MFDPDAPAPPLTIEDLDPATRQAWFKEISSEFWRQGNLDYKRHAGQKQLRNAIVASTSQKFYLNCSRRYGKTYELVLEACEVARRTPGGRILYLAPFGKNAAEIASDTMSLVLEDCPDKYRPKYNSQSHEFSFPHGDRPPAILRLKGVNGEHAQFLRGGYANLVLIDEAGQMDRLENVVQAVCMPMTIMTNGRIIIATTPPTSPGHDSAAMYEKLSGMGASMKFTIRDAPHISFEQKCRALVEAGEDPASVEGILRGELEPETTTVKREYFCDFVTDSESAVIPEFTKAAQKEIVRVVERPEYYDCYVGMDPGMKDRTGVLFGYVDFLAGTVVIEDECLLQRDQANTPGIAKAVKGKESALWGFKKPHLRVSDVDLRLQADLHRIHGLTFVTADKKNSIGAINKMRDLFDTRRIIIHPRCVNLIRQLENCTWNKTATDFERPGDKSIDGHFDLVAALKYLVRHLNWSRNPYPAHYMARGGPLGVAVGQWVSPKRVDAGNRAGRRSIADDTPTARRLHGWRRRRD